MIAIVRNRNFLIALGLAIITIIFRLAVIGDYSIESDDVISIAAARGILEYGIPHLPSGSVCYYYPLFHYLIAPVVGLFGYHEVLLRGPSIVISGLSTGLTYLIATNLRPGRLGHVLGLIAGALLIISGYRANNALRFGRMPYCNS